MTLTGQQYQQLTQALVDAFPSQAKLAQMVRFRLEKNLASIALGDNLQEIVFKLIETAEAEGWTMRLILSARESNPGNPTLLAFAQQFGFAPGTPPRPELERIICTTNSFFDINAWRESLGKIEGQVCRVEIPAAGAYGTGFLLGPRVVMTNYHVVESVIRGQVKPDDVVLRFDYKRLAGGTTLNSGTTYRLNNDNWLIDHSPYPMVGDILDDELDYALLRVADEPGYQPIGGEAEPEATQRGWIKIPAEAYQFQPGTSLFIVQHPRADAMKLALDTNAIIEVNERGTRVTYRTNTEPSSSGSPCFNSNWDLVALHHSGDLDWQPKYNAGTPLSAILSLLEQRGLQNELGEQQL